jgi:hypothetical protein
MIMFWNLLFLGQIFCKSLGLRPELDVSLTGQGAVQVVALPKD